MKERDPESPIDEEPTKSEADGLKIVPPASLLDLLEDREIMGSCPRNGDLELDDDHMMCCSAGCIIQHTIGEGWRHAIGD